MANPRRKPSGDIRCIYCGQMQKPSKEHVIQNAIGGWDWVWDVCAPCNNGMKDIDDNLAVKSPLAILAIRELDETGPRSWTHDPERPGLLLEARGGIGTDALKQYPQVVFDGDDIRLHCDYEEINRIGADLFQERFYARLRRAYDHYRMHGPMARRKHHRGQDMLKIQHVERLMPGERLPPRIFCREEVSEFGDELVFELKYHTPGDDHRILDKLSTFDWNHRAARQCKTLSAPDATVHFSFSLTDVMRAVTKIGFNLLAFHCEKTFPSIGNFQRTVEWIKQCDHADVFGEDSKFGFIHPADVASLGCPSGAHMFRLTHDLSMNTWKMYAAFFGCKAAAHVAFHGPNNEEWATMDVVAPYEKPMLPAEFKNWFLPLDVRITKDQREMIPSVLWTRGDVVETRTIPAR